MRRWPAFDRVGKHRLRSGLPITNDPRIYMPKSPRSIEDITTKASTGADHERDRAKEIMAQIFTSDDQ
jgi:hypothetical protein